MSDKEFKEQIVQKVKELNSCLTGYKSKYRDLSVVLSQEEYRKANNEIVKGGLSVEFIEKPTLSKLESKDIPLKVMELLEGKDYQQSQLILNVCQDMIKCYSFVSLKDSNASSNTLGANVNCSTDPS